MPLINSGMALRSIPFGNARISQSLKLRYSKTMSVPPKLDGKPTADPPQAGNTAAQHNIAPPSQ
jgi:hypothetical protein